MDAVRQMGEGEEFKLKMTPTDFRVTFAGDPREHRAFLAGLRLRARPGVSAARGAARAALASIEFGRSRADRDRRYGRRRLASLAGVRSGAPSSKPAASPAGSPSRRRPSSSMLLRLLLGCRSSIPQGHAVGAVATVLSRISEPATQGGDMMSYFALGRGRMESGPLGVFLLPGERVQELVVGGTSARPGAAGRAPRRAVRLPPNSASGQRPARERTGGGAAAADRARALRLLEQGLAPAPSRGNA